MLKYSINYNIRLMLGLRGIDYMYMYISIWLDESITDVYIMLAGKMDYISYN
jgi:hypothetical protein